MSHLKIRSQMELDRLSGVAPTKTVDVSLATLTRLLLDASRNDRAWLADFANEEVRIATDLHEVLVTYQQMRREAA